MGEKNRPTIAIMAGNSVSEYSAELIVGFRACAKEEDVNLVFLMGPHMPRYCKDILSGSFSWDYEYQFHTVYDYVRMVQPDAIIVGYGSLSNFKYVPDVDEFVARYKDLPLLLIGDHVKDTTVPCLVGGNYSGMRECIEHLVVDHGYRKIGFVAGPKRNFDSNQRLRAYKDVLTENGIEIDENLIVHGTYSENADAEVEELMDRNPGIEAIAFANDMMAKAGYRVCAERDLVVGHDIAITGFDDGDVAKSMEPPLTSVSHSSFLFSYRAVQAALELCRGSKPQSEEMKAYFSKRGSCGCSYQRKGIKAEDSFEVLQHSLKHRAQFITNELFSSVPYDEEKAAYRVLVEKFLQEIFRVVFLEDSDFASSDGAIRYLKKMCSQRFISRRLLQEYLESVIFELIDYANTDRKQKNLTYLMKSMQQYIHSKRVSELNEEIIRSERKMWFVPTFTGDLINARLDLREQMNHIMTRLQAMEIKSAYLFFFMNEIINKPDERLKLPDEMYLTAYYDENEMVCYQPNEMVVINKQTGMQKVLAKDEAHFYTAFPLFSGEEQYGVILCEVEQKQYPFMLICSMELGTLRRIINMNIRERKMQQELEEKNRILSVISANDELTQLLNRRGFMEHALKAIRENRGKKACLVFADVDHLKEINDTYGHGAGDFSICKAADYLRACLPEHAVTARIGGDEYVSLIVSKGECHGKDLAECMRQYIAEFNETSDKPYYVEMSAGIYEFTCEETTNLADLLNKSDAVLYEEKKKRRASVKK